MLTVTHRCPSGAQTLGRGNSERKGSAKMETCSQAFSGEMCVYCCVSVYREFGHSRHVSPRLSRHQAKLT